MTSKLWKAAAYRHTVTCIANVTSALARLSPPQLATLPNSKFFTMPSATGNKRVRVSYDIL